MFKKKRAEERTKQGSVKLEPLILQNSRLKFSPEQLQNLNLIFNKKLQYRHDYQDKSLSQARSVAERLIQRLLCAAGAADARFASKFLITSNTNSTNSDVFSNSMSYLIRLDDLSSPSIYELDMAPRLEVIENDSDCPSAYCRIRLPTAKVKLWNEFLNSNGFLRRDKVQTRLVELLAEAAGSDSPSSPLHIDESVLCGLPGKIVDAATLQYILEIPSFEQLYYGPGSGVPRFPDPRDFRLAIVDEPEGIRLRVEFLSSAFANTCLNIRLLIAVAIDGWPTSSSFPQRIPLVHSDCLLYHRAAGTGMYLVGFGVQSSAWQIRVPAAENVILGHYSDTSVVKTILDILNDSMEEIEISRNLKKHQISYKILNKYILLTALLEELETNSSKPLNDLIAWSPMYLSSLVLKILDQLMSSLVQQSLPNYFFRKLNLMVNPGHLSEDDYLIEANNIKLYLLRLFDESLKSLAGDTEFEKMMRTQNSEIALLCKWQDLINGLLPKIATRDRGFCFMRSRSRHNIIPTQYTVSQLDYISLVLKSILEVKQKLLQPGNDVVKQTFNSDQSEAQNVLEDVIYLIILLMDQAKDRYLNFCEDKSSTIKKISKLRNQFNHRTFKFVEIIRKDQSMKSLNLDDDHIMVKTILKWLHKAVDYNKRSLAPILTPYLNDLFETSFAISWHLDAIKERYNKDELKALGSFCKLVNSGEITPAQGLIDGSNKNWVWSKDILGLVEKQTLRIVFSSDKGRTSRHVLSMPSYKKEDKKLGDCVDSSRTISRRGSTLSHRNYFDTIVRRGTGNYQENELPLSQHEILKRNSPLSVILDRYNRRGEHRGCGDIFKSLMSMQKLNIFHEVTSLLPEEDRSKLSETIHQLQVAKNRRSHVRKWSNTLPNIQRNSTFTSRDVIQKYTPMDEGNVFTQREKQRKEDEPDSNSLIRNCRTLRLKEDNLVVPFQSDLRIKALVRKSKSFKY